MFQVIANNVGHVFLRHSVVPTSITIKMLYWLYRLFRTVIAFGVLGSYVALPKNFQPGRPAPPYARGQSPVPSLATPLLASAPDT